jgi:hypothetical protein
LRVERAGRREERLEAMLTVLGTTLATEDTLFGVHLGLVLRHLNAISSERGGGASVSIRQWLREVLLLAFR